MFDEGYLSEAEYTKAINTPVDSSFVKLAEPTNGCLAANDYGKFFCDYVVKNIDKFYLEAQYGQPSLDGLRILAVDEISVKKGHRYLTVVLDYLSGRVVFVGKDRKAKTLKRFFNPSSQLPK